MNETQRLLVSAHLLDVRGRACPAPIIELVKALRRFEEIELWADDPAAGGDLYAFVLATGHVLVIPPVAGKLLKAVVRRKGT
jgi:TusA-related sulfurtransferase